MRRWKLAFAVAIVFGLALWGIALNGSKKEPTGLGADTPKMPSFPELAQEAAATGTLRPSGAPDFSATFSGTKLDTSTWSTCYPWAGVSSGCSDFGNADSFDWDVSSQVHVSAGLLRLVATREPTKGLAASGASMDYDCRSGVVTTYPSLRFTYGYLQVVARIPAGAGLWPALWLAASDLKWPPEIDMLEHWGDHSGVFFHPVGATHTDGWVASKLGVGWHTYSLSWTKTQLTWFIDGTPVMTIKQHVPQQSMYFIANLAEYLKPTSAADCTGELDIRSLAYWKT